MTCKLAVEVRHPDWFAQKNTKKELLDMLESLGRTAVISDVAGRRDVLHMRLTSGTAFIRFNGHNLHHSDFTRIDTWIERLDAWLKKGLREIYFFMHQPDKALTAVCVRVCDRANKQTGWGEKYLP